MPKTTKSPAPARFHPAARFPAKPGSDAMQALSIVYQQIKGHSFNELTLSLVESFQLSAMLLKVHMTRALGREDGVIIYRSDIPSPQFARPISGRLTSPMIKSMQSKGYTLHVPPCSDVISLGFVSWARDDDRLVREGWVVHSRAGTIEPLHIDAEILPNEDGPYRDVHTRECMPERMQELCISP